MTSPSGMAVVRCMEEMTRSVRFQLVRLVSFSVNMAAGEFPLAEWDLVPRSWEFENDHDS